ncbi:hypothetical protein GRS96_19750 (plasmid) [Rathayibacter sp. VKM Ac-2803]|uniref:Uncharacterized protein n=1 Tax=Rathayibacter caricis DSM 15933 TaxID=1328867 RepID=A0A2T4UP81_9MICO|nr:MULTISPECIES: hypothetical protein [Rathayibacter]MWV51502.1 hypothetical protein [Rathayibacter sp. VKM Ac-2803]PTL71327.1 hypothetical protein C1I63_19080 [Rathayibacter caricis DSM 15933]
MTLHLTRTHQNRWIARRPRSRSIAGIITLLNPGQVPPVFRAEARTPFTDERRLLQDSNTLEIAFARTIASHIRATEPASFIDERADVDDTEQVA